MPIDVIKIDQLLAEQKRMAARLDQVEQKLDRVLAQGQRSENVMEPEPAPDVTGDDFAAGNLIELPVAAKRFETAKDTLRKWCREEGCGVKRGSRWLVSVPRVRARLDRK